MVSDAELRRALVQALGSLPDGRLAGAVLDRWDELASGMPMSELLTAAKTQPQKTVISLYAAEIRRQSPALLASPHWGVVNRAIAERWSETALARIKRAAWAIIDEG